MALGALQRRVRTSQRESSGRVIEGSITPVGGGMALIASLRESRLHMVWIRGAFVIRQVALHASPAGETVGTARAERRVVTLRALQRSMRPGQRESGRVVIERRTQPVGGRVALIARRRESGLHVIRIGRPVVIRLMALHTSPAAKAVSSARAERRVVALCALQRRVGAGQREARRSVVEDSAQPIGGAVALFAGLREPGLHVIRIGRALEIGQMALHARSAGKAVGATRTEGRVVALRALQRGVRPGKRKSSSVVIETGTVPVRGAMALFAGLREPGLHVIRIGRALVIRHVALHTSAAGETVGATRTECRVMALRALQRRVCARQRESGR